MKTLLKQSIQTYMKKFNKKFPKPAVAAAAETENATTKASA